MGKPGFSGCRLRVQTLLFQDMDDNLRLSSGVRREVIAKTVSVAINARMAIRRALEEKIDALRKS